jgi:cysteine-rich repeat protein
MKQLAWLIGVFAAACGTVPSKIECGDGMLEPGEQCDDGNVASGDGCSATCTVEATCGNNVVEPGEQCDDGNTIANDGCSPTCANEVLYTYAASWSIKSVDNTVVGCPAGHDTAAVYTQTVDSAGNHIGSPFIDLFDCSANGGTIPGIPPGRYRVWIEIANANNSSIYAKSTSALIDIMAADKSFSTTIYTNGGYFAFAWRLIGATSNNGLTCLQAGADGVELLATLSSSTQTSSDIFDCTDFYAITAVLAAGTYSVSIAALNPSNQSVGTAPTLTNRPIMGPNQVTELGMVSIPIDGK